MYRFRPILLLLVAATVVACGGGSSGAAPPPPPPPVSYSYTVPADNGDGWQVANLADEGFETQRIVDMMNDILDGTYPGIDSVAIVKNNKLVHYWYDRSRELGQLRQLDRQPGQRAAHTAFDVQEFHVGANRYRHRPGAHCIDTGEFSRFVSLYQLRQLGSEKGRHYTRGRSDHAPRHSLGRVVTALHQPQQRPRLS